MKKIMVSICTGTACFVMGASEIMLLEEQLPSELQDIVEVQGITCFEVCKNSECGKAPFVKINDEIISEASLPKLLLEFRNLLRS